MTAIPPRQLEELVARQAITDAISRCARGLDRRDNALIASAFHPDAVINYGAAFKGGVTEMIEWVDAFHATLEVTYHRLANHYVVFDDDNPASARGEVYVIGTLRTADQYITGYARYVDHYERRDGEWRISERNSVLDMAKVESRGPEYDDPLAEGPLASYRSPQDPSYAMFARGRGE